MFSILSPSAEIPSDHYALQEIVQHTHSRNFLDFLLSNKMLSFFSQIWLLSFFQHQTSLQKRLFFMCMCVSFMFWLKDALISFRPMIFNTFSSELFAKEENMAFSSQAHGNVVWKSDSVQRKKSFGTALWKFPKKYRSNLPPVALYQRVN